MLKYLTRIGIVTGTLIFGVVLWRLDWGVFLQAILAVNGVLAFLCVILLSLGVASRALRWSIIAEAGINHYCEFWRATQIGYLSNMLYPARAGEVIRIVAITRLTPITPGKAIGSSVTDRLLDGISLGLLLAVISLYSNLSETWRYLALTMSVGTGLVLGLLIFFSCIDDRVVPCWPILKKVRPVIVQALVGFRGLRDLHVAGIVLLVHCIAFGLDFLTYYVLLWSFGWELPFMAAVILKVLLTAASSLPSTPGYLGVYQIAAITGLGLYNIGESQAVAFSVMWQAVQLFVFVSQGGWSVIRSEK